MYIKYWRSVRHWRIAVDSNHWWYWFQPTRSECTFMVPGTVDPRDD